MASVQECERALLALADRVASVDAQTRSRYAVDRTLSWHVTDLDVVFSVQVSDGALGDLRRADAATSDGGAQVRLAACSDDLVALATGRLTPPAAWATGRLKVEASVLDLLRLRSWL